MSASDSLQPPEIRVYSRPGCHLCEQLVEELLPLIRGRLELEVIDIDTRAEYASKYGMRIPVVEYDGHTVCQHTLDKERLLQILAAKTAS
jgi:hypothetical protein